jgi:hypothetical protein
LILLSGRGKYILAQIKAKRAIIAHFFGPELRARQGAKKGKCHENFSATIITQVLVVYKDIVLKPGTVVIFLVSQDVNGASQ